jgi:hypothetical protein
MMLKIMTVGVIMMKGGYYDGGDNEVFFSSENIYFPIISTGGYPSRPLLWDMGSEHFYY